MIGVNKEFLESLKLLTFTQLVELYGEMCFADDHRECFTRLKVKEEIIKRYQLAQRDNT